MKRTPRLGAAWHDRRVQLAIRRVGRAPFGSVKLAAAIDDFVAAVLARSAARR